jgi:hypothetical protein
VIEFRRQSTSWFRDQFAKAQRRTQTQLMSSVLLTVTLTVSTFDTPLSHIASSITFLFQRISTDVDVSRCGIMFAQCMRR